MRIPPENLNLAVAPKFYPVSIPSQTQPPFHEQELPPSSPPQFTPLASWIHVGSPARGLGPRLPCSPEAEDADIWSLLCERPVGRREYGGARVRC